MGRTSFPFPGEDLVRKLRKYIGHTPGHPGHCIREILIFAGRGNFRRPPLRPLSKDRSACGMRSRTFVRASQPLSTRPGPWRRVVAGSWKITDGKNSNIREGRLIYSYLNGWWTSGGPFGSLLNYESGRAVGRETRVPARRATAVEGAARA